MSPCSKQTFQDDDMPVYRKPTLKILEQKVIEISERDFFASLVRYVVSRRRKFQLSNFILASTLKFLAFFVKICK